MVVERLHRRWEDNSKMDIREIEYEATEVIEPVQDMKL
jgi:hypothetical protein